MKKLSIIRFKPKPDHFNDFVENIRSYHAETNTVGYLMKTDDEVFAVIIRDSDTLDDDAQRGVQWLDRQRPLLQEFNEVDRHTIPITGDLVV
ncbi:MAG: hypothetical protein JJ872_02595 [Marivivens sp.]|jgi:hypothetical protein|nr:hypothetical protein [Marivivens sp.]